MPCIRLCEKWDWITTVLSTTFNSINNHSLSDDTILKTLPNPVLSGDAYCDWNTLNLQKLQKFPDHSQQRKLGRCPDFCRTIS